MHFPQRKLLYFDSNFTECCSHGSGWQVITESVNTLRPRQNGCHFPDDIFKWIFLNENVWISINISLKFVPRGPINNIPTLVQVMAWRRLGDKPLSEPMMVRLRTHICVTRPQWVNGLATYRWHTIIQANDGLVCLCICVMWHQWVNHTKYWDCYQ